MLLMINKANLGQITVDSNISEYCDLAPGFTCFIWVKYD